MKIYIRPDEIREINVMLGLIKANSRKVINTALKSTVVSVKKLEAIEIMDDLNIGSQYVNKHIKVTAPNENNLIARVDAKSSPVGLINFLRTRQTKKGVSVLVKKLGQRKILKHAFITTAKNAKNVFWRSYNGPRRKFYPLRNYASMPKKYRFPIERKEGPRLTDILAESGRINRIQNQSAEIYIENMREGLRKEFAKL